MLKPGVKVNEVYETMFKFIDEGKRNMPEGAQPSTHRGHGTGLDLQEPPFVDPYNEMVIEEGMTLSIEPWINQEKGSFFGIGDTFIITNEGREHCFFILSGAGVARVNGKEFTLKPNQCLWIPPGASTGIR
jgi:Xaa-Pro aminopeptidase